MLHARLNTASVLIQHAVYMADFETVKFKYSICSYSTNFTPCAQWGKTRLNTASVLIQLARLALDGEIGSRLNTASVLIQLWQTFGLT